MTLYARSDVRSFVSPDCPNGGHVAPKKGQFSITCPPCEQRASKQRGLWSDDPSDVPLSPAEEKEVKRNERQAMAAQANMAEAIATQAAGMVRESRGPGRPRKRV